MTSIDSAVMPWPPALNRYYRAVPGRGVLISADGRRYRESVAAAVLAQQIQPLGGARLRVLLLASMPDRRRRDLDGLLKALLDALTHAGVWDDDSQIDDLRIVRTGEIVRGGRIEIDVHQIGK